MAMARQVSIAETRNPVVALERLEKARAKR
jgi:hypothetical protein